MITLYGASGHAKVIMDIIRSVNEVVAVVLDDNTHLKALFNHKVERPRDIHYNNVLVAIGDNFVRRSIVEKISATYYGPIVHNSAVLDTNCKIGEGTVVMANVVINSSVAIGSHCIINTAAIIEHDVTIEDFVHVSPGAILTGGVKVGENSHLGAGSIVLPNIVIGKNVVVGAGAVVTKNIEDNLVVAGNPAKPIKKKSNMNEPKIWLSSPHMGGSERDYVTEAFDSNWVAPLGPNVNGFEEDLKKYLDLDIEVAALSSGTAAIHLALIQCGVKAGDEVICQSFTFCGSINPIIYQGATPILVDSEPETWNICPIYLEQAIKDRILKGKKPKAIIAVHLYGMPYKVDQVNQLARKYDIPVIEDSAEALGSTYKGQKCGTFSSFGVLSFNGNKIITTSGGGALVCKTLEEKGKTLFLATQARDNAPHYEHTTIGYNYRMSNISAGIGRGQMQVLDKHISLRRVMHDFYIEKFKNINGVSVFSEKSSDYYSNHWLSAILVDPNLTNGITREDLRHAFAKANIESRPLWKPMHLQPIFKDAPYYGAKVSENLFENGLCLPSGSNLTDNDRDRIEKVIFTLFSE